MATTQRILFKRLFTKFGNTGTKHGLIYSKSNIIITLQHVYEYTLLKPDVRCECKSLL